MDAPLPRTWLTERFGLQVPVVGAPMAGVGGGAFAAAVSGAGALGVIGVGPSAGAAGWLAGAGERLIAAGDVDTSYGRVFDVAQRLGWPPEYGGRALRNAYFDRWHGREGELAGDDAAAEQLANARRDGDFETAYLYAGQGVALLREERTAAQVVAELARAGELLARGAGGTMEP